VKKKNYNFRKFRINKTKVARRRLLCRDVISAVAQLLMAILIKNGAQHYG
jgi:hypothetical protein